MIEFMSGYAFEILYARILTQVCKSSFVSSDMVTNDIDNKPFQLKFVRPAQMMLFANVICDPPFGQITVISPDKQIVWPHCVLSLTGVNDFT